MTQLTVIPLNTSPGRLFRSPMPFRHDDGTLLEQARTERVGTIVMLTSDEEAFRKSGRNLRDEYKSRDLRVVHLPIEDFSVPAPKALDAAVDEVLEQLRLGTGVLVHCAAGIGRTGMFLACVVASWNRVTAEGAMHAVRAIIPGAIERKVQEGAVEAFVARRAQR